MGASQQLCPKKYINDDNERNHFYHCLGPFFGSFHGRSGSSRSGTRRRKWSQANGVWTIPDLHDIIDDCTDVKDDEVNINFCFYYDHNEINFVVHVKLKK